MLLVMSLPPVPPSETDVIDEVFIRRIGRLDFHHLIGAGVETREGVGAVRAGEQDSLHGVAPVGRAVRMICTPAIGGSPTSNMLLRATSKKTLPWIDDGSSSPKL